MPEAARSLTILGATGSIGTSAARFLRLHPGAFRIEGLAVDRNWEAAATLADEFGALRVAVRDAGAARRLREARPHLDVLDGEAGVVAVAAAGSQVVLAAIAGSAGLPSTIAAIRAGSRVALANKESLVCGGPALLAEARARGVEVFPTDSEHTAIHQCLLAGRADEVHSLVLTASGGPFRHSSLDEMRRATPAQAVAHPNWSMGTKISLDSATLANKGLELIEACYLFDVAEPQVEVVVNPTSTFHSAVQFVDGSMIAQIGTPDMRASIGYALGLGRRRPTGVAPMSLLAGGFEFWHPDLERFPALALARQAVRLGQGGSLLFNAANEVAGGAFLGGRIGFMDIPSAIEDCLEAGGTRFASDLDTAADADREAKAFCTARLTG